MASRRGTSPGPCDPGDTVIPTSRSSLRTSVQTRTAIGTRREAHSPRRHSLDSPTRPMSPWLSLLLALLLLSIPGVLLRATRGAKRTEPLPEIRGPLRWAHGGFRMYCALWHGLRTEGYAPLPETGPAILISNHTCGIDHMLLQAASRRVLGFMIARE